MALDYDFPTSTCQITKITGMYHHAQQVKFGFWGWPYLAQIVLTYIQMAAIPISLLDMEGIYLVYWEKLVELTKHEDTLPKTCSSEF
jgi:hypothetical protein